MEPLELAALADGACERLGIEHYITGSLASAYHGIYRTTHDVDVVVELALEDAASLCAVFSGDDWYVSVEAARDAARRRAMFNVIHAPTAQKIDFIVPPTTPFQRSAMSRARTVETGRVGPLRISAPEDVIISKLLFHREGGAPKHLSDIAGILKVSGASLDRGYLDQWTRQLGVEGQWQEILERVGPSDTPKGG